MSKGKFFIGFFIFIVVVLFTFYFIEKMQPKKEVYSYLPQLSKFNLYDVKFEKIYADPSYTIPYNVLISFKTDTQNLFSALGLIDIHTVDTSILRSASWVEEYKLYFTMSSINAVRYTSIENKANSIKWWNVRDCNDNYAAPYSDMDNKRKIVTVGQKNNGRIVCCKIGKVYYILIEVWG